MLCSVAARGLMGIQLLACRCIGRRDWEDRVDHEQVRHCCGVRRGYSRRGRERYKHPHRPHGMSSLVTRPWMTAPFSGAPRFTSAPAHLASCQDQRRHAAWFCDHVSIAFTRSIRDATILHVAYSSVTTCSYASALTAAQGRHYVVSIDTQERIYRPVAGGCSHRAVYRGAPRRHRR